MDDKPDDLGQWIQELTKRSVSEQIRGLQRYNELIQRVSRGDLDEQDVREEYMRFAREESLRYARQLTTLSLRYYNEIIDLYRAYNDHFFHTVFGNQAPNANGGAQAPAPPRQVAMELHAPIGEAAQGSFILENKRTETVEISFLVSEFVEVGGTSTFRPPLQIQPPRFTLGPHEEKTVSLMLPLFPQLFEPGKTYAATIVVRGYENLELVLQVQVEPASQEEEVAVRPVAAEAEPAAEPQQDLTALLGIGPRSAEKLRQQGITTYASLADMDPQTLADVLGAAGYRLAVRYRLQEQARLAAQGDEAGLGEFQKNLRGAS